MNNEQKTYLEEMSWCCVEAGHDKSGGGRSKAKLGSEKRCKGGDERKAKEGW
jgi:hypothetical protein